ncbi:hypothetical protein MRX96_005506 [Rhipicephalus microplus]
MYGSNADGAFFTYESATHMRVKVLDMLQSMLFAGMPTCLAVYALRPGLGARLLRHTRGETCEAGVPRSRPNQGVETGHA